jgi:hypothetical protein
MEENSIWKGTNEAKLIAAEQELLNIAEIDLQDFKSYKVYINIYSMNESGCIFMLFGYCLG